MSLAAHWSSWIGRGLHDLWDLLQFVLIQLFTLEHWLQSFEPLILSFFEVAVFWEALLATFSWMYLFIFTVALVTWRKQEREPEWHWFREEGEDGWEWQLQENGCGQRRGMCQARTGEGVLWDGVNGQEELGWIQLTLTLPLDLSWQEVFIFLSWVSGVGCSITSLELCGFPVTLVILKSPSGLLQSPWAPLYIYTPPQRATPLCFMRSASHFPSQWWPWVSLDITKPHLDTSRGGWRATQTFWWEKWGIFNAPKEPSKLTCHPHLSKSTLMCHMAGRVCLLQTLPHSHTIQSFNLFSYLSPLSSF